MFIMICMILRLKIVGMLSLMLMKLIQLQAYEYSKNAGLESDLNVLC